MGHSLKIIDDYEPTLEEVEAVAMAIFASDPEIGLDSNQAWNEAFEIDFQDLWRQYARAAIKSFIRYHQERAS